MRYVVTALAYSEVMILKRALAAQDIEAGVTVGALAIRASWIDVCNLL